MRQKGANGEGGLRQRVDGRWEARYSVEVDGAWQRRSVFGKTRVEVAQKLRSSLKARDDGAAPVRAKESVGSFLEGWLAGAESTLRPRTAMAYRQVVRDHLIPHLGRTPLARLRPEQIQAMHAAMLRKGRSPKTIANTTGVLHAALQQACRWRLIPANVASLVRPPHRARPEMHVLDPEQVRALLDAADEAEDPYATLWALALSTGLRQGELLGLAWADIDLERGLLHVRRSLTHLPTGDVLGEPKSASSRRSVRLGQAIVDRLARHRSAGLVATGPVFRRDDGRPLSSSIVLKAWHQALKRAGLPLIRFHDARHSVATTLLARGLSPRLVADVLGHANVSTTLAVYAHSTASQHDQAAAILGEALG